MPFLIRHDGTRVLALTLIYKYIEMYVSYQHAVVYSNTLLTPFIVKFLIPGGTSFAQLLNFCFICTNRLFVTDSLSQVEEMKVLAIIADLFFNSGTECLRPTSLNKGLEPYSFKCRSPPGSSTKLFCYWIQVISLFHAINRWHFNIDKL